ncbi:hypothetical protein PHJA_002735600 [Phtheirospermum japonicum]|uniref:Uncharacterized protein n=1 Tax=Phtheirospermum japonicum TaxID=374723 RepID=A0A830DGH8_9LAMI|nr:hypothetical protein PHJA_002735600 [Phtheirospermum japonicum]
MVMEVVHEDMGDGNIQCTNHPYKNSAPGGICAFCLQEKLGKLVSSSFPIAVFPSSSSSPSPSFRSDFDTSSVASAAGSAAGGGGPAARHLPPTSSQNGGSNNEICYYTRRSSRLPFVLTHRKKKKNHINNNGVSLANGSSENTSIVFKRSKSTVTPRRRGMHFLDESFDSPYKKGFWSFLYTSKHKKSGTSLKDLSFTPATPSSSTLGVGSSSVSGVAGPARSRDNKKREDHFDENESPDDVGLDRKVSRSRSVGCGSRSFSGDFFERISTGFGDCTLRRVESQREGKSKVQSSMQRNGGGGGQDCIKERVRCGGIFSGFMITSSSSSSSSMVSEDNNNNNGNGKTISVNNNNSSSSAVRNLSHGRSKSWGWALASPMRAFSKPPSNSAGKRGAAKHGTPNLAAIPSLLAVSS